MNLPISVEGPRAEWHNSINATKQQAEWVLAVDLFHWPSRSSGMRIRSRSLATKSSAAIEAAAFKTVGAMTCRGIR
jgi:hypothetical protein